MRRKSDLKADMIDFPRKRGIGAWQGRRAPLASRASEITRTAGHGCHDGDRPDERHVDGRHRRRAARDRRRKSSSNAGRSRSFPTRRRSAASIEEALETAKAIVQPRGTAGRAGRRWSAGSTSATLRPSAHCWSGAGGVAKARNHRLSRPDRAAPAAGGVTVQLGDGALLAASDRHLRSSTTCAPTTWRMAGRARRWCPPIMRRWPRSLPRPCDDVSGRLRQYRRHFQHHLCRGDRRSGRLRHRARAMR